MNCGWNKLVLRHVSAVGVLFFASILNTHAEDQERPNIIWLMAEDIGQDLSCYGMKGVETPTLDSMASEGRQYNNAICANPICSPNRSAMMIGVNPTVIDAHMHRSNRAKPLPEPYKPITYYLRKAGYTCLLGHDLVMGNGRKIDCNFKTRGVGPYDGVKQFGLFDKARSFEASDAPFFAQIQLVVTHRGDWWNQVRDGSKSPVSLDEIELPPYIPDTPKTRLDWATYLDTMEYMDNEVTLLKEDLEKKGLLDNTIIIFIGDNGRCNIRGKGYLHEPGIRVPMIIWGPEKWVKKAVVDEVVSVLDISATVLDLAGAVLPDYLEGAPLLSGDGERKDYVYSSRDAWDEVNECMRSVTTKQFSYIRNYMSELPYDQHQAYLDFNRPALHEMRRLKAEGQLHGNAALFMVSKKAEEELYDIENDPHQLNNLAANPEYAGVVKRMRNKMTEWQSQYEDLGLKDYRTRGTEKPGAVPTRTWLKENHPEEWQMYLNGGIGERLKEWMKAANPKPTTNKKKKKQKKKQVK